MTKPQNIKVSKNPIFFPCVKHFIIVKTTIKYIKKVKNKIRKSNLLLFYTQNIFSKNIFTFIFLSHIVHCL